MWLRAFVMVFGLASVGSAQAAAPYAVWRVDAAASTSKLSNGLKPWREQALVLTYRPTQSLWLSTGFERSTRFGLSDELLRLQVAKSLPKAATVTAAVSRSPNAVFRSRSALQLGYDAPRLAVSPKGWALGAGLDSSNAHYRQGSVQSVQPYLTLETPSHAVGSLKVIETWDEAGRQTSGYAISAATPLARGLGLKLAYVDAPESEAGRTQKAQAVSETLTLDVGDELTLRFFGVQERRRTFDRSEYGLSFARRF